MQAEFLAVGEVEFPTKDADKIQNACDLIDEEKREFDLELPFIYSQGVNVEHINELKECLDLMYVCAQFMNQNVGPEIAMKMLNAVHKNNMGKFPGGKCIKSPSGKILKPDGFDKNAWKHEFLGLVELML